LRAEDSEVRCEGQSFAAAITATTPTFLCPQMRRPHDASVSDHRHALTPAPALAVRGSNVCRIERGEPPTQPSERIVSASAAVASTGIPLEKIVNAGQY